MAPSDLSDQTGSFVPTVMSKNPNAAQTDNSITNSYLLNNEHRANWSKGSQYNHEKAGNRVNSKDFEKDTIKVRDATPIEENEYVSKMKNSPKKFTGNFEDFKNKNNNE